MIVITTFYNASKYIDKCIKSLIDQSFKDFKCFLIDDVSTDNSYSLVKGLIEGDDRFTLIKNDKKKYKTLNYISILNGNYDIDENDVVVELDGDDWLSGPESLSKINEIYSDENIWITNGSFVYSSGVMGFSSPQINFNTLRSDRFTATHLRTWRVFLWRKIKDEDHKDNDGNYLKINADLGYMLPMLEMAGSEHYKFIPDTLLVYNEQNPLNDHKINMSLVNTCAFEIRFRSPYKRLKL
jgi:glycosyltransferase involved in cell wall biosynthesis